MQLVDDQDDLKFVIPINSTLVDNLTIYMKNLLFVCVILTLLGSCTETKYNNALDAALQSDNPKIKAVMDSLDQFELQIKYTQIDQSGDSLVLTDFDFQTDTKKYFYPASSVKFPVAVLAMEKLNKEGKYTIDTKFQNRRRHAYYYC